MSQLPNAYHFEELSDADQESLLDYIDDNFKMVQNVNHDQTAYGLKARYNRITGGSKGHHVTSQCFMEAMLKRGYKAVQVSDTHEPNWYFNVGKTKFTD